MVSQAIDAAEKAATSDTPVSSTSSFTQTFVENQIIEWSITTAAELDKFDDKTWAKVFSEVDLRQLVVIFETLGIFNTQDGAQPVKRIDVTVDYPTVATQTFSLYPTAGGAADVGKNSTYTFTANGDFKAGVFNSYYTYRYEVIYEGPTKGFKSPDITANDTRVVFNPADFGIRNVKFLGSAIPFKGSEFVPPGSDKAVSELVIDFYFTRPEGVKNKADKQIMKGNGDANALVFSSFYNLPLENSYAYRLTYHFIHKDGTTSVLVQDSTPAFGSQNTDLQVVTMPVKKQEFTLMARKVAGQGTVLAELTVQYKDPQNNVEESENFSWEPDWKSSIIPRSPKWEFYAPQNLDAAYYEITGTVFYDEGERPFNGYRQSAKKFSLTLTGTELPPPSVEVDTSRVDWTKVFKINVSLFQMKSLAKINPLHLSYYLPVFPAGKKESQAIRKEVTGEQQNNSSILATTPNGTSQPVLNKYFYALMADKSAEVSYWIGVQYVHNDGTPDTYMPETPINRLVVIIPADGTSDKPTFSHQLVSLREGAEYTGA